MLKVCDGCKDGLDTDKDGSSISTKWGCACPFRANGAQPSLYIILLVCVLYVTLSSTVEWSVASSVTR